MLLDPEPISAEIVDAAVKVHREYDGQMFYDGLRVDLLVNSTVVVEIKAARALSKVHFQQIHTCLRLLELPLGLLLNFGEITMKGNMRRIVNRHTPSAQSRLRINQR